MFDSGIISSCFINPQGECRNCIMKLIKSLLKRLRWHSQNINFAESGKKNIFLLPVSKTILYPQNLSLLQSTSEPFSDTLFYSHNATIIRFVRIFFFLPIFIQNQPFWKHFSRIFRKWLHFAVTGEKRIFPNIQNDRLWMRFRDQNRLLKAYCIHFSKKGWFGQ